MSGEIKYRKQYATGSINGAKHPYLRKDFWLNTKNHFWNSNLYSEASKDYLRNHININL